MLQGWDPGHRSCELINPGVHRDTCIFTFVVTLHTKPKPKWRTSLDAYHPMNR